MGTEYTVSHNRKGKFRMRVTKENDTWVTGIITDGSAQTRSGLLVVGDEITVRKSFARFYEVIG